MTDTPTPFSATELLRVSVADGKYTYVMLDNGKTYAERYGEEWRDLTGDKFVYNLAEEIADLRLQLAERDAEIERLQMELRGATSIIKDQRDELDRCAGLRRQLAERDAEIERLKK